MNELFMNVINRSISASLLIMVVLIIRLALKKAPKWVSVLLRGIRIQFIMMQPLEPAENLSLPEKVAIMLQQNTTN